MDHDDRARARTTLSSGLGWPVTAREVEAAPEQVDPAWRDAAIVATGRLADDRTRSTVDDPSTELDPLLAEAGHRP